MRNRTNYILVAVAFILQPFLNAMLPWWVAPNLGLALLIMLGLTEHEEEIVAPLAWIFGLTFIVDAYSSQYIGVSVISSVLAFLFVLALKRNGNVENLVFSLLVITGAMLIYKLSYWAIYAALGSPYSFLYMVTRLPGESISTILLTLASVFAITRELIQQRRDKYFR